MSKACESWLPAFDRSLNDRDEVSALKVAALSANLGEWTRLLTHAVISACEAVGWRAAGRGHRLDLLPKAGQEYLGIDVMAFAPGPVAGVPCWPLPLAVFELENARGREAYSLWKVICVRSELRVVFAYRKDWEQVRVLVRELKDGVIASLTVEERLALGGDVLLVTGSRGEGETFPHGYFKIWRLNPNIGDFEKLPGWG